jgi:Flp pilus assembly pilin Flp
MEIFMHRLLRFWKDDTATTLLEYGVLVGLIMAAAIGTVFLVGRLASGQWTAFNALLP